MSRFFASGGQSIGVSASASVLPMNIQDWFPWGWTGWVSLQSKGLSACSTGTTEILLQCLTSTVSRVWLHYSFFLEPTVQRLTLLGHKFRLCFPCCHLFGFCLVATGIPLQFLQMPVVSWWASIWMPLVYFEFLKVHLFEYSSSPAPLVWFFPSTVNFHFILWLGLLALILRLGLLPLGYPVPLTIQTLHPLMRSTSLPSPVFILRTPVLAGSCLPDFHQLSLWFGGRDAVQENAWTTVWWKAFALTLPARVLCATLSCWSIMRQSTRAASGLLPFFPFYIGNRRHTFLLCTSRSLKCWTCNWHPMNHLLWARKALGQDNECERPRPSRAPVREDSIFSNSPLPTSCQIIFQLPNDTLFSALNLLLTFYPHRYLPGPK